MIREEVCPINKQRCKDPEPPSDTVVRQTDFHVIIGQRVVFDMNLARAILSRRETLSDGEVKACVLP